MIAARRKRRWSGFLQYTRSDRSSPGGTSAARSRSIGAWMILSKQAGNAERHLGSPTGLPRRNFVGIDPRITLIYANKRRYRYVIRTIRGSDRRSEDSAIRARQHRPLEGTAPPDSYNSKRSVWNS